MAIHSSILAWKSPWAEEPGGLQSLGSQKESDRTERLNGNSAVLRPKCEFGVPCPATGQVLGLPSK